MERQVCKVVSLPTSMPFNVVRLHAMMAGPSHHFIAYRRYDSTRPITAEEATVRDCDPGAEQVAGTAEYLFGSNLPENTVELPSGIAFRLDVGQQIVIEQHMINTTLGVVQGGVVVELHGVPPGQTIEHYATVASLGNWVFAIPPGQQTVDTARCQVPYDLEVFVLLSHAHALLTHFSIDFVTATGTTHIYDNTDWMHPLYLWLDPRIPLRGGDSIEWTCTWWNPGFATVYPGKNFVDEMCIARAWVYSATQLEPPPFLCDILP
jgi:hypothetical protein